MNRTVLFLTALLGSLVGGVLTWLLVKPPPSTVVIEWKPETNPADATSRVLPAMSSRDDRRPGGTHVVIPSAPRGAGANLSVAVRPQAAPPAMRRASDEVIDRGTDWDLAGSGVAERDPKILVNTQVVAVRQTITPPPRPQPTPADQSAIDTALSFALKAADPYIKKGFTLREDYWGGQIKQADTKTIVVQLFRGNEYWFWMGTNLPSAPIYAHVYDANGKIAEVEHWEEDHMAAARILPEKTAQYYLVVGVGQLNRAGLVPWALAYGFR